MIFWINQLSISVTQEPMKALTVLCTAQLSIAQLAAVIVWVVVRNVRAMFGLADAMGSVHLARFCAEYGINLVCLSLFTARRPDSDHLSLDLDGALLPLGLTKAMEEIAVQCCPSHYIIRLDRHLISNNDAHSIAETILDMLKNKLPYGTYSSSGHLLGA